MRSLSGFFTFLLMLCLLAGASGFYVLGGLKNPGPLEAEKNLVIARHSSSATIAAMLEKEGVIAHSLFFRLQYFLDGRPDLKAGEYHFTPHMTLDAIIGKMARGEMVLRKFTIPEGWTSAEVVALLQKEPALSGTVTTIPPEGSLLPDTYRFTFGDDRNATLALIEKAQKEALMEAWAGRDPTLPLANPQQLLTLASIVEKETGKPEERPRVAGVYVNRLRKGMLLQSDPTVIYGLTMGRAPLGRPLNYADLDRVTPYNSYRVAGMPPTPIANPGKAALMAAAKPEKHDYLYFVADGTGGHRFATTVEEHKRNVENWRRLEKAVGEKR